MTASKPIGAPKVRIFLVDDHPIVRRGFQLMINLERDLQVCGEADSGPTALERIAALQPDVAIVDLTLKSSSGLDLIKQLRVQHPKLKILVFSMHDETFYAERVLRSGAHGYLTKEEGTEKAIEAVRWILQGKKYFSQNVTAKIVDGAREFGAVAEAVERLSDREVEVLDLIGRGMGSRQIAEHLHLSIKTIESHREHIKSKLKLSSATELTKYAYHWLNNRNRA
jgi:DNA-binding NarL/FixJ family response regulator